MQNSKFGARAPLKVTADRERARGLLHSPCCATGLIGRLLRPLRQAKVSKRGMIWQNSRMNSSGVWTQLITIGAVLLGGVITLFTTWLANLQQNRNQKRERREDRLAPVYLGLQIAIRDLVRPLESYALAGFPEEDFVRTETGIQTAFEALKQITYKIDFMSPPRIAFDTELLEDSIVHLIVALGFHVRLVPVAMGPEARNEEYVRSELQAISVRRIRLLEIMRDDLGLTEHAKHPDGLLRRSILRSRENKEKDMSKYGPLMRDPGGFLIDDGRYRREQCDKSVQGPEIV
jgi:hypothetical protein